MKLIQLNLFFAKILSGDDGDNVTPVYFKIKETKGGPRRYKITEKHINEIMRIYKKQYLQIKENHFFSNEHIEMICLITKEVIKITDKTVKELVLKWKKNRDLMMLHKKMFT